MLLSHKASVLPFLACHAHRSSVTLTADGHAFRTSPNLKSSSLHHTDDGWANIHIGGVAEPNGCRIDSASSKVFLDRRSSSVHEVFIGNFMKLENASLRATDN